MHLVGFYYKNDLGHRARIWRPDSPNRHLSFLRDPRINTLEPEFPF